MKLLSRYRFASGGKKKTLSLGSTDPDIVNIVRHNVKYLTLVVALRRAFLAAGIPTDQSELIKMFDGALSARPQGEAGFTPISLSKLSGPEAKEVWILQELLRAIKQVEIDIDISWFRERLVALNVPEHE